jgi:anti-sigma regulatory factor (Ser/Thr protein kinase)
MDEALPMPHLPNLVEHERTLLRLPSRPDWIEPAADYLCRKAILCGGCPESNSGRLLIALHEALSNAVVHGNLEIASDLKERGDSAFAEVLASRAANPKFADRTVEVLALYDGSCCQWVLTDQGPGFDVDRVLRRHTSGDASDDPELLLASGRGILMMRAFLDDVRWEEGGRRVILTLCKTDEKRQSDRRPWREPVRVAPVRPDGSVDWEAAYEAVTRNLSAGGLALLQDRLATTDRVLLGISTDGEPLYVPAEVRHLRQVGANEVELGCRFVLGPPVAVQPRHEGQAQPEQSAEEAVGELLDRLQSQSGVAEDRRKYPRVVYTEQIGLSGPPGVGFARDLSRGGIAFITTAAVELGVQVLTLPQGPDRVPMRVQARIVRCRKIMATKFAHVSAATSFYDVAAEFLGLVE